MIQFDGLPVPPLPSDHLVGPHEQIPVFLLLCLLLLLLAYLFFDLANGLMSEEFRHDLKQLQARRNGKKWWQA